MKLIFKDKKYILLLLLIPFISIIMVIAFRNVYNPTNEEIIDKLKDAKMYSCTVKYLVNNDKGEYEEQSKLYYCKDKGMRIEFENDRVKIYKDGFISMNDRGYEYQIDENLDKVYPLAFMNSILSNNIVKIQEGSEEWGDAKYIEVEIELPFKNNHMNFAKLYINKNTKSPIITKIYDMNNKEKMQIIYDDFKYLDKINDELF
ncbi:MAG: hypothetical protein E7213_04660 [Clostridium sp.]|nr:hypothetical protein [Clostridium sp.]